jgi:hypothetical protein
MVGTGSDLDVPDQAKHKTWVELRFLDLDACLAFNCFSTRLDSYPGIELNS